MAIPKKYTPEETALRRDAVVQEMRAYVGQVFDRVACLNSALVMVAQYWSDEANDAVHYDFVWSELEAPDLAAAKKASLEEIYARDWEFENQAPFAYEDDPVNFPRLGGYFYPRGPEFQDIGRRISWEENLESISLFAAYCPAITSKKTTSSTGLLRLRCFSAQPESCRP